MKRQIPLWLVVIVVIVAVTGALGYLWHATNIKRGGGSPPSAPPAGAKRPGPGA